MGDEKEKGFEPERDEEGEWDALDRRTLAMDLGDRAHNWREFMMVVVDNRSVIKSTDTVMQAIAAIQEKAPSTQSLVSLCMTDGLTAWLYPFVTNQKDTKERTRRLWNQHEEFYATFIVAVASANTAWTDKLRAGLEKIISQFSCVVASVCGEETTATTTPVSAKKIAEPLLAEISITEAEIKNRMAANFTVEREAFKGIQSHMVLLAGRLTRVIRLKCDASASASASSCPS